MHKIWFGNENWFVKQNAILSYRNKTGLHPSADLIRHYLPSWNLLQNQFLLFQNFDECQFFEHDIAENGNKFLKECPDEEEKCCFSLREHMTIEFWGRE